MKKALFSRLLTIILILGLMSATITPQNVNAATITPQTLFAADEIDWHESAANGSSNAWANSDALINPPPPIIQSISGSLITFDNTAGHPGAYVPGVPTTLYFKSDVYTNDYEWLENTWLKFPTDWTITDVTVAGTPTCDSGTGAWGNFQLLWENQPYGIKIQHSAIMATMDHCTATYAIQLTPGAADGTVLVSWYFAGDTGPDGAMNPHYVCSNDRYTPGSMGAFICVEGEKPQASIPLAVPPVAVSQSVTTLEDTAKAIPLVANDPDGGTLTYSIVTQPAHGAVGLAGNVATYTPYANYNGADLFTFKANDGMVDSNVATINITVTPVADAPIAQNQTVSTVEDTARVINLLATDADGNTLTYSIVTQPAHGVVVLALNAATYTPNANYTGPDSFTFRANDGIANSNNATISITVNPVNDPPVAQAQSVTAAEDTPKVITLGATDIDGGPLTYSIVVAPLHGTFIGTAPNLIYTPALNYNGADSFTFKANDGARDSNIATVTITVTPVNDLPISQNQSVSTAEDSALAITLVATDVEGATLTYYVLGGPTHGVLSGTAPNLTYTPAADYNGVDSFTFMASDGTVNSNTATVSISVTPVNDAPVAQNQSVSVLMNSTTAITLIATDVDNDPLTYLIVTPPGQGAVVLAGAVATYTPITGYLGSDTFTFKANDGTLESNTATVNLTVKTDNNAPVAQNQSVETPEDTAIGITLLATDADILDSLTFSVVQPAHGVVVLSGAVATYTPALNYNGSDSFTFTATDGIAVSNVATVTITVLAVNDNPTNLALSNSIVAENTAIGTLVGTFSTTDPDTGDTFNYSFAAGGADNAAFNIAGDQLFTNALFDFETKSSYSIWIRTTDQGQGNLFFEKDFTITVTDVNEAPTNLALSYSSVAENMAINTVVGTLSTTDQDLASTFTYTFASGGADNAAFNINGNQLRTNAMFDFETKSSYLIRIRTTDQGDLFFEKDFTITVTDVNEAPVVSDIPNQTISEGLSFTTINLDAFVSDSDNTAAEMTWTYTGNIDLTVSILNQVATITIPNVDWNGSETITFRATDPGSLWDEDLATFNVTAVNDAPVALEGFVATNKDVPVAITLVALDVDGDALTYTVVVRPRFGTLSGSAPNLTYTPDAGFVGADNFSFMANDLGLLSNPAMVSITVNQTTRFIYLPIIFK